ncbi:hypothetical protein SERLA73DRAFT_73249, partial [Serpula lacrymans var. lacrymans S7.3]
NTGDPEKQKEETSLVTLRLTQTLKPRPLVTPDTPPPQSLGAAAEALEPDNLYQSAGPENFPPPPPTPEPENQPDDWFDQESLDLEPDLAAAMADETNQGSKAVLATPPFEFIEVSKPTPPKWSLHYPESRPIKPMTPVIHGRRTSTTKPQC